MSVQDQLLDDRTEHPEDPGDRSAPSMRTLALLLAVVASIGLVGGLAYWDAVRESRAALEDLALEQVNVAKGIAAALALGTDEIKQSVLAGVPWGPPGLERSAALKWFLL